MNRRSLMALLATTALAGCNRATRASGEADVTASTGDWTQFRGGPQRRGSAVREYSFERGAQIHETGRASVAPPVVHEETAIVPSGATLLGLNLEDQSVEYEIDLESTPTLSPARCSSVVAVVTAKNVAAYDVESQSPVWTLPAQRTYDEGSAPAALGRHFVVQDADRIRLVEHESGSVVWSREFDARLEGFAASEEMVVINRNTGDESEFIALDSSNGETEWSATVESGTLHPVIGEFVFALSEHGRLVAIEGGDVRWSVETEALNPKPMAITEDFAVVVSEPSDRCTGVAISEESVTWQSKIEFGGSVVAAGDRAFVSGANAGVIEFDIATGERIQTFEEARFVDSLVPVPQGLAYTHTANDRVYLLRET